MVGLIENFFTHKIDNVDWQEINFIYYKKLENKNLDFSGVTNDLTILKYEDFEETDIHTKIIKQFISNLKNSVEFQHLVNK